jgi:RsiW-degrading membrane proteinase PrsW (M82 family)
MSLINLGMALAPAIAIALFVYFKDKYEKEPVGVLVACFIFGVLICFPAGIWNSGIFEVFGFDLDAKDNKMLTSFFMAFFVVGLGEETLKYLVLILYAYRKESFNEPFDGIVYAVMVSLGFAALENIFYVMEGGMGVAILRMFTAVPMHAGFAVIMGYYVGLAKFYKGSAASREKSLKGLFYAVLLHGFYDFVLFQDDLPLLGLLIFPMIIWVFFLCKRAMKNHLKISPFNPSRK